MKKILHIFIVFLLGFVFLGAQNQVQYYQYLIALNPKRIIFNPGAENEDLARLAEKHGIEAIEACTLVMLSIGNY